MLRFLSMIVSGIIMLALQQFVANGYGNAPPNTMNVMANWSIILVFVMTLVVSVWFVYSMTSWAYGLWLDLGRGIYAAIIGIVLGLTSYAGVMLNQKLAYAIPAAADVALLAIILVIYSATRAARNRDRERAAKWAAH